MSRTFAHPEQVSEATRIKVGCSRCAEFQHLPIGVGNQIRRTYRVALLIGSHAIECSRQRLSPDSTTSYATPATISSSTPSKAEARDAFFEELPVRNNADAVLILFRHQPRRSSNAASRTAKIPIVESTPPARASMRPEGIDDKEGIKLIVRHLAKLGHRNLLYLYESFSSTLGFSSYNRITGFRSLRHHRWYENECAHTGRAERQHHRCAISEMMAQDNPLTALCFTRIRRLSRCSSVFNEAGYPSHWIFP